MFPISEWRKGRSEGAAARMGMVPPKVCTPPPLLFPLGREGPLGPCLTSLRVMSSLCSCCVLPLDRVGENRAAVLLTGFTGGVLFSCSPPPPGATSEWSCCRGPSGHVEGGHLLLCRGGLSALCVGCHWLHFSYKAEKSLCSPTARWPLGPASWLLASRLYPREKHLALWPGIFDLEKLRGFVWNDLPILRWELRDMDYPQLDLSRPLRAPCCSRMCVTHARSLF